VQGNQGDAQNTRGDFQREVQGSFPLFYVDASSCGDDLQWGASAEVWWDRIYSADSSTGTSDTTPESLTQRCSEADRQLKSTHELIFPIP
jgi:hypothetical protein